MSYMVNNLELSASVSFLKNPTKIVEFFNCEIDENHEIVQEIKNYLSKISDLELSKFLPILVKGICNEKPELKVIYEELHDEIKRNIDTKRGDVHAFSELLSTIKENWEAIAIIAIFLRSLGRNKIVIEGNSVFDSIINIVKKSETT